MSDSGGVHIDFDGPIFTRTVGVQIDDNSAAQCKSGLVVIRGDEVSEKPLAWMWKPYLPLGKLVHFGGNSSQAKSPVVVDLAARITSEAPWPDGTKNEQGPRSVILLNIEDDLEDTILPRFRLAGGDKTKLYYVKGTRVISEEFTERERGVVLTQDIDHLAKAARNLPDLGLIAIDPITNYLGNAKMNAEEDVRALLTPLANLAAQLGIVVITVGHFNRREKGTDPLHRMMGAAAFSGVARAVYSFGPDPDEESKFAHVMTVTRACGGEGSALRYRTELVQEHNPETEIIKVVWLGKSTASAEDASDPMSSKEKSQTAEAAQTLAQFLGSDSKPATECEQFLREAGFDLAKLDAYRIRKLGRIKSKRIGKGWHWYAELLYGTDASVAE